jgi:hypothetical protein
MALEEEIEEKCYAIKVIGESIIPHSNIVHICLLENASLLFRPHCTREFSGVGHMTLFCCGEGSYTMWVVSMLGVPIRGRDS